MDAAMHRNLAAGLAESRSTSTPRIAKAFLLDVAVFLCASNDLGPVYKFYTAVRVPSAKAQLHTSSRGATSRGRPDRGETAKESGQHSYEYAAQGARAGDPLFLSVEQPDRLDYAVNR